MPSAVVVTIQPAGGVMVVVVAGGAGWVVVAGGIVVVDVADAPGQAANSQLGGTRPTTEPSGQIIASIVQAVPVVPVPGSTGATALGRLQRTTAMTITPAAITIPARVLLFIFIELFLRS